MANGWTDPDEIWHAGRPPPWPHCVRWGPSSSSPKGGGATQCSAHICCSQMAGWIKMPLDRRSASGQATLIIIIIIINDNVYGAVLMTVVSARVHPVHNIKTVSGKVLAHSIAFRVVSIYWQRDDIFPLKSCLQVTCPLLSMVSYGRCQNS